MTYSFPDVDDHKVVKGVYTAITQRVYVTATEAAPAGFTSGTVVIYDDAGSAVSSSIATTWTSGTATYSATVDSTYTSALTLPQVGSAVWTDSDGVESKRRVTFVARVIGPPLITEQLTARYPELSDIRTTAELRTDIAEAWSDLEDDLRADGILLHQVTDTRWLQRLLRVLAACSSYKEASTNTGEDRWSTRAMELQHEYAALKQNSAPYDADADDVEDSAPAQAADDDWFWPGGGRRS